MRFWNNRYQAFVGIVCCICGQCWISDRTLVLFSSSNSSGHIGTDYYRSFFTARTKTARNQAKLVSQKWSLQSRLQIQISDSHFRCRFQIQSSDVELDSYFRFRFRIQIFRFKFQIQIADLDFRFKSRFQIRISDSNFKFRFNRWNHVCVRILNLRLWSICSYT